jgi:hypothetical protein
MSSESLFEYLTPTPKKKEEKVVHEYDVTEGEKDTSVSTGTEVSDDEVDVIERMNQRKSRKRKEPESLRQTVYIKREIIEEMDALQRIYGYGFKTELVNIALRNEIRRIKSHNKKAN